MAISVNATRPKAEANQAIVLPLELGAIQENDDADSVFLPLNVTGLTVPDFAIANVTITSGSDVLTVTNDSFVDVQVGDTIAAGTAIATITTVIAKTDNNNIQVSAAATGSGTETLTFTPSNGGAGKTITVAGIELGLIQTAQGTITIQFTGHVYDGSLGDTLGTNSNATSKINLNQMAIDIDSIFSNARIPREN